MRYWVFVFVLILVSFGLSGVLYIRGEFGEVASRTGLAQLVSIKEALRSRTSPSTGSGDNGARQAQDIRGRQARETSLLFVGDVMLARGVQGQIRKHSDFSYPFRQIVSTLREADFVFGNLEGPISSRGANQGSEYSFRADPRAVEGLKFAGFDVLSLANNHIWDWGTPALLDTVDILNGAGIRAVGVGANADVANAPAIVNVSGTRLGVLAYTNLYPEGLVAGENSPGVSNSQLERVVEDIRAVRNQVDLVIVSYHWGEEYVPEPSPERRELARAIIDAGADLIIGHHPHVVQEVEKYKDGWVAYSLGNFVFDQNFSEETMRGEMLRVVVRGGEISRVEKVPIRISKTFQPYVVQ
ncbi:MAG: CapA family protein [Candidatus Wolfebacteria bacterium]|nr:CapA family protein [Candidatus Wolfebacteria bacterium]MDP2703669.1 CapA family protein [bacterium]